ncbi:alpha/beta hydrolase [Flavobacterium sp. ANB]|uniref:RBBP9/YdeN family alpha/beta hydrolase n=1 Tax=unclassified Flavobacterium TaxID=196869 RepID=UPI0012B75125|nr:MULTISPECIES: alpha/beta hydrolase [unclassified Flavobacterium]MBF4516241.1 alpha/beta hydrolase [Flavobacterium sp. ANB]MTD69862.1 alpha/beta hydrolase [Flavobacterium sp. LC2016-13]
METQILILPGLGDSGEKHWQTFWHQKFENSIRLVQDNWDEPILEEWLERLNEEIAKLDRPTILVAHSLAVSLVLHWAATNTNKNIVGAFLVAPADVDSPQHTPEIVRNFSPIPIQKLPFPSVLVASENDPYALFERKKYFAEKWGSDFVNVGKQGHINSDSDLKYWEEGQEILAQLITKIDTKN